MPIAREIVAAAIEPLSGLLWSAARDALSAVNASGKAAVEAGNVLDNQLFGQLLSRFIWQRASLSAKDVPGVNVKDCPRFLGLAQGTLYLRFKSLREDGFPWPPTTSRGATIARQRWDEGPVITLGVRTSKAKDEIIRLEVQCLKHEREFWWNFGLPEQVSAGTPTPIHRDEPASDHGRFVAVTNQDATPTEIEE